MIAEAMVRRLPVLQNNTGDEAPFTAARAMFLGVGAALLFWAVLLWVLGRWGTWGVASSLFLACVAAGALAGSRATREDAMRVGVGAASVLSVALWAVALIGRALPSGTVAIAALCAVVVLCGAGFGGGIFSASWRRRAKGRTRH